MTDTAGLPRATSVSPTVRQVWTRARGLLLALVVLLAAGIATAAIRSDDRHGRLDPRSADPYGSRAVAELLEDHGVSTRVVTTIAEATTAAGPESTLLVATPDLLTEQQQSALRTAVEDSGGRTILLAASAASIETLAPGVIAEAPSFDSTLSPDCPLPEARRAGDADTGGIRYTAKAPDAQACYPSEGLPTLLRLPAGEKGDTVLLGSPDIFYNNHLDKHGNASLALQLLGSHPHLVWYLPSLTDASATDGGERSLPDLIPSGWSWATLQLAIAAALTALWRARRLGPLVTERLPVVIRASESAEGRARLYRKTNARGHAADVLRSATRARLAPLVGVPPSEADVTEALLPTVSAQLDDPTRDFSSLLFGPPPADDAALVTLADQLDALEREVRTS